MTEPDRLQSPERKLEDLDAALRLKTLSEIIGQEATRFYFYNIYTNL